MSKKDKEEVKTRAIQSNYLEDELKNYIKEDTEKGKIDLFYNEYYVAKKTKCVKGKKPKIRIDDFVAKQLLNIDIKKLYSENIKKYTRENYNIKRNETLKELYKKEKLKEVEFAKIIFDKNLEIEDLGKIIHYQTPIRETDNDKGVGDIDLLAYNEDGEYFTLIELKLLKNKDTMLHCILQIYTYFSQINEAKLKSDFGKSNANNTRKAVLIFENSKHHKDYIKSNNYLQKLTEILEIDIYIIDNIKNINITKL